METLKNIIIKKTRKDHECNSCLWIYEVLSEIKSGELRLTISERRHIVRMKQNGWKIPKGSTCGYYVQIDSGVFYEGWYDIEIDKICHKHELYPDDTPF